MLPAHLLSCSDQINCFDVMFMIIKFNWKQNLIENKKIFSQQNFNRQQNMKVKAQWSLVLWKGWNLPAKLLNCLGQMTCFGVLFMIINFNMNENFKWKQNIFSQQNFNIQQNMKAKKKWSQVLNRVDASCPPGLRLWLGLGTRVSLGDA